MQKVKEVFIFTAANVTADTFILLTECGGGVAYDAHLSTVDNGGTTPTSDVTLEGSWDNGTNWVTLETWTQVTTVNTVELETSAGTYPQTLRLNINVGGTPDYTYTLHFTEVFMQ